MLYKHSGLGTDMENWIVMLHGGLVWVCLVDIAKVEHGLQRPLVDGCIRGIFHENVENHFRLFGQLKNEKKASHVSRQ